MLRKSIVFVLAVALGACAPAAAPRAGGQSAASAPAAQPSSSGKPLNLAVRYEVNDLAPKRTGGAASTFTKRAFNAYLAVIDSDSAARPYLAESLPQLNSDSWRVFADGRMETTYKLRPNLTWHDGRPLTSDDFVFALQVYTSKGLGGTFISTPQDQMDEIVAADARTFAIKWRTVYPQAGALTDQALEPLPRHILEAPFRSYEQDPGNIDPFLSLPYWTTEYVGVGPFKVDRWEPGSTLEGTAFDGHALGRPKIDRLIISFVPDENTVLTSMLAGAADITGDNSIRYEHAKTLKQQWDPTQSGVVIMQPGPRHWIFMQLRPELQKTPALLDLRVRRALAHAIDRDPLNEALFDGQGFMTDHFVHPKMPYAADVDKAVTHYPFDPRRAAQFMSEAGLTKDSAGFFADSAGVRFRPQFVTDGAGIFIREMEVIQNMWKEIGIDMDPQILPGNIGNVNENRTTFPGMYASSTGAREAQLDIFSIPQIATASRRWLGQNRGGWENAEYDRLWTAFNSTLDRRERDQQIVDMMKVVTDQLPGIFLYFNISPEAHQASLRGPMLQTPETLVNWNMWEWSWR